MWRNSLFLLSSSRIRKMKRDRSINDKQRRISFEQFDRTNETISQDTKKQRSQVQENGVVNGRKRMKTAENGYRLR
jgi:hypothetical protein